MTARVGVGVGIEGRHVALKLLLNGKTRTAVVTAAQARAVAKQLLQAADVLDAGGQPHGHA